MSFKYSVLLMIVLGGYFLVKIGLKLLIVISLLEQMQLEKHSLRAETRKITQKS